MRAGLGEEAVRWRRMKGTVKDPFRDIREAHRARQRSFELRRREDRQRLRRCFFQWNSACRRILKYTGIALGGRNTLLQKLLVFLFGKSDVFLYLLQGKMGYRLVTDESTLSWNLYLRDSSQYDSYEDFKLYHEPFVSISFETDDSSEPIGFRVVTGTDYAVYTSDLSEQALVELLRSNVVSEHLAAQSPEPSE